MSPCLEFEGKSVDKAVETACAELKISKDKLKYDIISYGSSGIFGLVAVKKAKIKVILKETPTAGKKEKRPDAKPAPAAASKEKRPDAKPAAAKKERRPAPKKTPAAEKPEKEEPAPEETAEAESGPEKVGDEGPSQTPEPADAREITPFPPETLELGKTALQKILDFITTDAEISVEEGRERLLFDVRGGNSAILIGKRGQTLDAIQYLLEKILNKSSEKRIRIQVDVEGYLDNRQTRLRGLATRLAEKAKQSGKPVTVGQLNAHDRRIIHLSLRGDNTVRTQSMGDGPFRKLVIFPKKSQKRRRQQKDTETAD